jgi:5-methyltetrahydropteroyltriglutamate--homocysteine methyltransferase
VGHPYRAEHVGSLLRPVGLLEARAAHAASKLSLAALRHTEDRCIEDALELQRAAGLDIFSDGEFRRSTFLGDLTSAVEGFSPRRMRPGAGYFGGHAAPATRMVAAGRLKQTRRLADVEANYLLQHAPGAFKITLPTPFQFVNYEPGVSDHAYLTPADLLADLANIIAAEVHALIQQGVKYIQIDAPRYSYFLDPRLAGRFQSTGSMASVTLAEVLAADNLCVGFDHADDVTTAIHICRGNARSTWYAEGGYDAIAEQMFNTLNVDRFLLEYDDARSGGFEPLRFVPPNKVVVLGLVTTKFDQLEDQDAVCRRIDAAAHYVPLDRLALSPQCGFASLMEGNLIDVDTQRRKLELVAHVARMVWS